MSRPRLYTQLCEMLGVEYPVMLAGMGKVARTELVAAVSNAGGFGVIGAGPFTPDELRQEIRRTRELTDKPFGVDLIFALSMPDQQRGKEEVIEKEVPKDSVALVEKMKRDWGLPTPKDQRPVMTKGLIMEQIKVCFDEKIPLLASGLGDPGPIIPEAHERGIKVAALVGSVKQARRVVASGVDLVVAQGHECGGHTGRITTMVLVPQVVDTISPAPVVAAGGIGDGRGLAAALALGAVGVWCGTVFLATKECPISDSRKKRLVAATEEDTRVTRVYTGKTARFLNDKVIETWDASGLSTLPFPQQMTLMEDVRFGAEELERADLSAGPAGQVVGLVKGVPSAMEVVERMVRQAAELMSGRLASYVAPVAGSRQRR